MEEEKYDIFQQYAVSLFKAATIRARRERETRYNPPITDRYSAFRQHTPQIRTSHKDYLKAIGFYFDSDDVDHIESYLEGENPGPYGKNSIEFFRSYSHLGNQVRILLKNMDFVEVFRGMVDSKRRPYHTRDFQFAKISGEDNIEKVIIFGLPVKWDTFDQRLRNEKFEELSQELHLPDISDYSIEQAETDITMMIDILKFNKFWSNSHLQLLQRRADELISHHFGDERFSVENILNELKKIED
jgi:hypothetical protein